MHSRRYRQRERGYTILELSVVLAIAGILIASGVSVAFAQLRASRGSDLVYQGRNAVSVAESVYQGLSNYSGISVRQLIAYGAFNGAPISAPQSSLVQVTHALGGAVGVSPVSATGVTSISGAASALAWGLYFEKLPADLCGDILSGSHAYADAVAVLPAGSLISWPSNVSLNAATQSFLVSGTGSHLVKNLNSGWQPSVAANACAGVRGGQFGLLILKTKSL